MFLIQSFFTSTSQLQESCLKNTRSNVLHPCEMMKDAEGYLRDTLYKVLSADTRNCLNLVKYDAISLQFTIGSEEKDLLQIDTYIPEQNNKSECWYPVAASMIPRAHKKGNCEPWKDELLGLPSAIHDFITFDQFSKQAKEKQAIRKKAKEGQAQKFDYLYTWAYQNDPKSTHVHFLNPDVHCNAPKSVWKQISDVFQGYY